MMRLLRAHARIFGCGTPLSSISTRCSIPKPEAVTAPIQQTCAHTIACVESGDTANGSIPPCGTSVATTPPVALGMSDETIEEAAVGLVTNHTAFAAGGP